MSCLTSNLSVWRLVNHSYMTIAVSRERALVYLTLMRNSFLMTMWTRIWRTRSGSLPVPNYGWATSTTAALCRHLSTSYPPLRPSVASPARLKSTKKLRCSYFHSIRSRSAWEFERGVSLEGHNGATRSTAAHGGYAIARTPLRHSRTEEKRRNGRHRRRC